MRYTSNCYLLGFSLLLLGCSRSSAPKTPVIEPEQPAASVETTSTQIISASGVALSIESLLRQAKSAQEDDEFEEALRLYSIAATGAQNAAFRRQALVGRAESLDALGRLYEALEAYQTSLTIEGLGRDLQLEVRVVRLLNHLDEYQAAGALAAKIPPQTRPALDQIALKVALGLAALKAHETQAAREILQDAASIASARGYIKWRIPPYDLAGLYFGQAELLQLEANAIGLDVPITEFPARVEERCQALLVAQRQYSQVLRVGSAHWSAMAGVQVAQLYLQLHTELIAAAKLAPAETREEQTLVEGALRLRYSVLLRKGVALMRTTLALIQKTAPHSPWAKKAEAALMALEQSQQQEGEVLKSLPYTEAELQKMLDDLGETDEQ